MRLNRTGFVALAVSSLGFIAPTQVQAVPLPIPGVTVDVPGTVLNAVPPELQRAISTFYTSDLTRITNPTAIALESDDVGALERAFAQSPSNLLVMSRATYLDATLLQWPIGTSESIVAIILPRARLAWLAYRKPSDAPFDGRKIARNLASTLNPKLYVKASDLATALGWKLVRPNVPDFEYQFQRPNATDPKALDRFNWSVPRLEAALTLGVPTGTSAFLGVQASRVTLITPPARIGASADPYLGLEVAQILNDCSLEGLTTTQATYRCGSAGNPFTLNVTTNR
jgi:hypothetical protein